MPQTQILPTKVHNIFSEIHTLKEKRKINNINKTTMCNGSSATKNSYGKIQETQVFHALFLPNFLCVQTTKHSFQLAYFLILFQNHQNLQFTDNDTLWKHFKYFSN